MAKAAPRAISKNAILQVHGLAKSFGGLKAVQDVSFEVRRGEILGIIGPNGAGKTTLFNLLGGLIEPNAGAVQLEGQAVDGLQPSRRCALGMARTFQVARPFPRMDVLHNVVVGAVAGSQSSEQQMLAIARGLASSPQLLMLDEPSMGLAPIVAEGPPALVVRDERIQQAYLGLGAEPTTSGVTS